MNNLIDNSNNFQIFDSVCTNIAILHIAITTIINELHENISIHIFTFMIATSDFSFHPKIW